MAHVNKNRRELGAIFDRAADMVEVIAVEEVMGARCVLVGWVLCFAALRAGGSLSAIHGRGALVLVVDGRGGGGGGDNDDDDKGTAVAATRASVA